MERQARHPPIGHEHVPKVDATDGGGLHQRELRVACVCAGDVRKSAWKGKDMDTGRA